MKWVWLQDIVIKTNDNNEYNISFFEASPVAYKIGDKYYRVSNFSSSFIKPNVFKP